MATADHPGQEPLLSQPRAQTLARWLNVWTIVGIALVLVVAGFLIAIVIALFNVSSNLGTARDEVVGVRENVQPLPRYVGEVNRSLRAVRASLAPIPADAGAIGRNLSAIDATLDRVAGSLTATATPLADTARVLGSTSGSLHATTGMLGVVAGTLRDTTGPLGTVGSRLTATDGHLNGTLVSLRSTSHALVTVRRLASQIHDVLVLAERPQTLGAAGIYMRVAIANGPLGAAERDARAIYAELIDIERHLVSVCRSATVSTVGALHGASRC